MMKNIFFIFLIALSFKGMAQAPVTADPALGQLSITDLSTGQDRSSTVNPLIPVKLSLPVLNLSLFNAIPNSSTTVIIGLGSRMVINPSYNLATAPLSTYFNWSYNTMLSQPRIIGTQIRAIPADFLDSVAVFQVYGSTLGTSTVSANFSINPGGNVDDADGNNNSTSLQYTVIATTLPVNLTQFNVVKNACNIDINFNTENEVNLSRFEIEVSKNGTDFTKIGEIPARNASRYNSSYPITDGIKSANLFVRLKSVDKDEASFQYSSVKRIAGTCDAKRTFALSAYPNPIRFGRSLTITSREGSFDGKYSVSLMDATGRTLQVREMQLNNVSNFKFDIGTIASGQYLLKVSNTDQTETSIIRFQKN